MYNNLEFKAWLCIASDGSTVRVGDNFDEIIGETYIWPKTIPQAKEMAVGDAIVLWDKSRLLGFSWIEQIEEKVETIERYRCPNPSCRRLDIRERETKSPRFKCGKCTLETDDPGIETLEEEFFKAHYGAGWVSVETFIDAETCRLMTINPNTQHSIRAIDRSMFVETIGALSELSLRPFTRRTHGHVLATVRVRIGQGEFRRKLREEFGDVCAFTGPNHSAALEAAHLYSYAEYGVHHDDGGLLLRRDIHRLFDKGLIAVNPSDWTMDIHANLQMFGDYANLHGKKLAIDLRKRVEGWLEKHWDEFRNKDNSA